MLHGMATHDGFVLKFERPAFLADVEYDGFHTEILSCYLSTQACTHAWVQKQQSNALIGSKLTVPERVGLISQCFCRQRIYAGDIINRNELVQCIGARF